jgi:hypothetical protein
MTPCRYGITGTAVLLQIPVFGAKSKVEYQKFNALRTQKLPKKQLCDRTGRTHGALVVLFSALQLLQLPALHWFSALVVRKFFE